MLAFAWPHCCSINGNLLDITQDMKAGVVHCRCSKCFSVPSKKRVRRRIPALTLLSLPEEVLLFVFQGLPAQDLLSLRAVHSQLRDAVDSHATVWARASFADSWPSPATLWLFERAAERGNFEAAVKLGIAYLYNEGPSLAGEGRAETCGRKASRFFSLAESLRSPSVDPFIWVFIRPPWSPSGSCCKAVVYEQLRAECNEQPEKRGSVLHCLARVAQLFDEEERRADSLAMLEESSRHGCLQSSYLLWESKRKEAMVDPGRYLQCLRTLRDYAAKGSWEAQMSLAKICSSGIPLGLEPQACSELMVQLFQSSRPVCRPEDVLRNGISNTMRYILVDWLVEVTTMKDFSSLTLHTTVSCVNRYLSLHSVPKARLQLLGIACMVICTRYISREILTIREAVWLTDNTYKYEDLVRMMGEVISTLEGKMRTPTLLDYGEVLLTIVPLEKRTAHMFSYICELSLLHTELTRFSPARLACTALLLTRGLHRCTPLWPAPLAEYTGFSQEDLTPSAIMLYTKCSFCKRVPKDYKHGTLTGVKQRFEDEACMQISKDKVMKLHDLCQVLGVPEWECFSECQDSPMAAAHAIDMDAFLSSPAGNSKRRRGEPAETDRGTFVATPTAELSSQEETLLGDILDWSLDTSCSGYEGDQESEGEKDGEVLIPEVHVELEASCLDSRQHCRALSSDEDSLCEWEGKEAEHPAKPSSWRLLRVEAHSSGYSSVQSISPSLSSPSSPSATFHNSHSLPQPSTSTEPRALGIHGPRQVKRKNAAAHSSEEEEGL